MKLKDILAKISPLPWKSYGNEILNGPRENRPYQIHAANVLPETVLRMEIVARWLERSDAIELNKHVARNKDLAAELRSAIERASEVKYDS